MDKSKIEEITISNLPQSESDKPPELSLYRQISNQPSNTGLISYNDLPSWHQDNPSIYTSYRPISHSISRSLKSLFTLHNETLNIHTHSLPFLTCLLLTGLIFYIFSIYFPHSPLVDKFIFAIFFLTTTVCMGLSTGYHTLMNHSQEVAGIWLRLDFCGIVVAILGDFVTGIYVAFYCEWKLQVGYWVMIITLTSTILILLLHPRFQGLQWRTFRVCMFIGTACSAFAPIINGIVYFGWHEVVGGTGMPWYLGEGGVLVLGAMVYALRIPECYFPGKFDIIGHSHQIFHLLVVGAAGLHLVGLLKAYNYEYYHPRCGLR
ncbi:cb01f7fd-419a-4c33-a0d2-99a92df966fc [Sclerotinia trifoliorum]|uniref:Cb01f7fd-419a-4c33-a0d2-99a92df966fc n=1 Tax=Sclerotinia trifoliorum TaxID=28548 RepID=A0A8H2ZTW3_9HELO|nr:cb01f7fd-419a-4c33-a0d2-99a92df966fc [Sclerotinia trifoliorum]